MFIMVFSYGKPKSAVKNITELTGDDLGRACDLTIEKFDVMWELDYMSDIGEI